MDSLSTTTIGLFLIATMFSLGATAIWPRTQGFTRPIPTALSILMQVICLVLMNRIIDSGVELSFLIPLNGARDDFRRRFSLQGKGVSLENRCLADSVCADWFCKLFINRK